MQETFKLAGFNNVETAHLDIDIVFKSFDDYLDPFLGGQGPAGTYLVSLPDNMQKKIKNLLQNRLKIEPDGSIKLLARLSAVRRKK